MVSINSYYQRRWDAYLLWLENRSITSETICKYVDQLKAQGNSSNKINAFLTAAKYSVPDGIEIPEKIIQSSTEHFYEQRWSAYITWLGERPVSSKTLADYVENMKERHYSQSTLNAFLVAASHLAPSYIAIPPKVNRPNVKRMPKLTQTELDFFKQGIPSLKPDQQADIHRLLRGEKPKRQYAAYYLLVQRVGLMTLGRAISPNQIIGLERQENVVS